MPTTKPRYAITKTEEIAAALDAAGRRWPEESDRPSRLLVHLIQEGHRSIGGRTEKDLDARQAALRRISGSYTGMYGPGYLDELRGEWPE